MPFTVGLTGGIGSGKSEVACLFAALGASVVDTDAIAHELTAAGGAAIEPIRRAFGAKAVDASGALDRAWMRKRVFADAAARGRLESILHPLIRERSLALCAAASTPYVLLMVPLLVESGADRRRYQRILVVDCPEETQIARVMARSALSAKEVRAIMATQATRAQRLAHADDVIDNAGSIELLPAQIEHLHRSYLALAGK